VSLTVIRQSSNSESIYVQGPVRVGFLMGKMAL